MSLQAALSISSSGLDAVTRQLAVVSQNVANAGTAGYARQSAAVESVGTGNQLGGVQALPPTIAVDLALQSALLSENAGVSGLQTQQTALQGIDQVAGTPGQGQDLASKLGVLQDSFSTLLTDPSNQTQQAQVVISAGSVATQLNNLSQATQAARQGAQDGIVSGVASLAQNLAQIGQLNSQIIATQASGQSTATLQEQRNGALQSVSQLIDARFLPQPDGSVLVATASGLVLPTDGTMTLSTQPATMDPANVTPPPILLGGADVTAYLAGGGSLGANITLRDTTLPTAQAGLDEFAQTLATRFDAQGLTLFTTPSGTVPTTGVPVQTNYLGFAGTITLNPAIVANPTLVRDGTHAVAGSPTGASAFTPNPAGGPAGFSTLVSRILNQSLGAEVQPGVAQPAANTTGLGATGTLAAPYLDSATLAGLATNLVGAQAQASATASSQLTTGTALQTALQTQLNSEVGVNMDTEMSHMVALQNAYGANARIMTTVQSMFSDLLQAIQ